MIRQCLHCGNDFTTYPSLVNKGYGKYCSIPCRSIGLKGNQFAKGHKPNKTTFKKGLMPWNKGKHWSEEIRTKISKSHIGQKSWNKGKKMIFNEETLERIRNSHRGHIPWNKGKKGVYSKEVLQKMKESRKGITAWNKGLKGINCAEKNPNWKGGTKAYRQRRKKNLQYCISERINSLMRAHLKKGSKGKKHWEDLVGYSVSDLETHLKKTMPEGFTWQDYVDGKLHIDHIIPVSVFSFDTPEHLDFKRCWALNNLRLLPARENLSKGNKLRIPFQTCLKI